MLFVLRNYYSGNEYIIACLIFLIVMVISFTFHEFAHAFVAVKSGDDTPKIMGRYTLNPLSHIDPLGFVMMAIFFVGYAKPVQVNPIKFKHYRRDMALVSVAGVITNLMLAFISCGVYIALITYANLSSNIVYYITMFFSIMFSVNISLAVFNFLPFYPLDGFNFLDSITSSTNGFVNFLRKNGTWILLVLLLFFDNFLSTLIYYVEIPFMLFWGWIF